MQVGVPFSGLRPLPNSIARWTLSRLCGTPRTENVRAYAVVLQTDPTPSSRTAFSQPASAVSIFEQCQKVVKDSCHLTIESTRRRVSYETRCPAETGFECTESPGRPSVRTGTPLETDPLGLSPRSQGSGLTILSPQIMSTKAIRSSKGGCNSSPDSLIARPPPLLWHDPYRLVVDAGW